jgi:hypothetical protein
MLRFVAKLLNDNLHYSKAINLSTESFNHLILAGTGGGVTARVVVGDSALLSPAGEDKPGDQLNRAALTASATRLLNAFSKATNFSSGNALEAAPL